MLVLTRKVDQELLVGDHVRIVVLEVAGDRVKLGIDAPRGVAIRRPEASEGGPNAGEAV